MGAGVQRCRGEFSPAPVPLCTLAPLPPYSSAPLLFDPQPLLALGELLINGVPLQDLVHLSV